MSDNPIPVNHCGVGDIVVLDFYKVMDFINDKVIGPDVHDAMFGMFPDWCNYSNDSYWHLYRDWIKTEGGKQTWDTICELLEINQDLPAWESGYKPTLSIVFWVSW